jgi:hypothetical protein
MEEGRLQYSVSYGKKLYRIEISCGPYIVIPYRGIVCKYILYTCICVCMQTYMANIHLLPCFVIIFSMAEIGIGK